MFQTKSIFFMVAALSALPMFAQYEGFRSEVSAQGSGSFIKETTKDGIKQDATKSGGVLTNYRFYFNQHHGVEVNYGYTLNTERYSLSTGTSGVETHSHEATAAYVFRVPFKRWSAFALAGAGGLVFDPNNAMLTHQGRAAFVYGGGVDVDVTKHVFLRAQYRGLVYNSPTYDVPVLAGMDRITHRAVPSAGLGFRF
jgi:opacity protein-like surface antigen